MKFKNQLVVSAIIQLCALCTSTAYAFEGHYVGSSIGATLPPINHFASKDTNVTSSPGGGSVQYQEEWSSARRPSFNWSLHSGYGKMFGNHYCGAEVAAHRSRYRMKATKIKQDFLLDTHDEFHVRMRDVACFVHYRHGYKISDTVMVFVKLGVSRNKVKMNLQSNHIIKRDDGFFNLPAHVYKKKVVYPFRIAFEIEKMLNNNVAITGSYSYERIGSIKIKCASHGETPAGLAKALHVHRMTIQTSTIMFGLKCYTSLI